MKALAIRDLRLLGEIVIAVLATWLLLGWPLGRAISQSDGTVQWIPYTRDVLASGADWQHHLYRFSVVGGSTMHDSAGTLPLLQVGAWLGLSATATANLLTVFLQVCFAFFGVKTVEAFARSWFERSTDLSLAERLAVTWICAFAPTLAWQYSMGHENLLVGLLPLHVALVLTACVRARSLSPTLLLVAAFAMFMAASGLGAQIVVYGLVFGGPTIVTMAIQSRPWTRMHTAAVLVLVGGALVAMPRLSGMIAYVTGNDFARADAQELTFSFGSSRWSDWLSSIPWTAKLAMHSESTVPVHERNVALGPWLVLVPLLWPSRSRKVLVAVYAALVVAVLFATDVGPVASVLTTLIPPLESFRVPARAVLVVVSLLAPLGMAGWLARSDASAMTRKQLLVAMLAGVAIVVAVHGRAQLVRECVAWGLAIAAILAVRVGLFRVRPIHWTTGALLLGALAVCAFDERVPRFVASDPIENGPAELREKVLATAPDLAMPLNRIDIAAPPKPYEMSLAFAAGLPSLDGAWYPTRRFLWLLSALSQKPVDPTSGVFQLGRAPSFPVLQQLYNVRYRLHLDKGQLDQLPATPGPAWFPSSVEEIADARALGTIPNLRDRIATTAFVIRSDTSASVPDHCASARVIDVKTDSIGQTATITVSSTEPCVLVVATNVVESLHATIAGVDQRVIPVDVALTGVIVPAGDHTIVLAPRSEVPLWALLAATLGVLGIVAALVLVVRR